MMENKPEIRVKFKIGEIEFEAEGSADLVERERSIFSNTLLPSAVDAIVRTSGLGQANQYIEAIEEPTLLAEETTADIVLDTIAVPKEDDYSRMNLASYIRGLGNITEQEFTLFAAYFDEIKNETNHFTKDDLQRYYSEARRTAPSNLSMSLNQLAKKGLIMDAVDVEKKMPKPYIVSTDGMQYISEFQPKQEKDKKATKAHKKRTKEKSQYADINCDELNLSDYPDVKSLKDFKEKMMTVVYILTKEEKGEWFTISDVLCLMTDIFGEDATNKQIEGVFSREKQWFKTENIDGNKKLVHRKLLNQGKEFVQSLIQSII